MDYSKILGKNRAFDFLFRKATSISIECKLRKKIEKERQYYIICRPKPAGFFSDYFYVLGHMVIADKMGLIPYVDMENYPSLYSESEMVNGTRNAWEYFFEQDNSKSLEEIYACKHIVCEEKYPYAIVPYYSITNIFKEGYPKKNKVAFLNRYIERYIPIQKDLLNEFEETASDLKLEECIGIHIRGTDMNCTPGHNKPRTSEDIINYISSIRDTKNVQRIFLCTDEESIRQKMVEAFKGEIEIFSTDAYRSNGGNSGIHLEENPHTTRKFHKYNLGVEVLRDAYLLSKCNAFICGKSNVAYAAIVLNNNRYEWIDCH